MGERISSPDDRMERISKVIKNEALIESVPSMQFLDSDAFKMPGGSIYYGTGLTTPKEISKGLPFDTLGMMLTAEKIRRAGGLDRVFHHIADTHAKTNSWIDGAEVDRIADVTSGHLNTIKNNLGLDSFVFVRSSSFDSTNEYADMINEFMSSDQHEYVIREMADMEWYRTREDVRLKLGWIIQANETELGFDERRFDREYLRFRPGEMSFVYTKPGRTFNKSIPKASPYISTNNVDRLMLSPDEDVAKKLSSQQDPSWGGAKKHIGSIVRLYESIYGSLGKIGRDGVTLESKIQSIINHCFSGKSD
ncbi:hypothetical protein CR969_01455 [Candidatus Saccharibacteria bacterium]|nr:MAG: hypothetical protein CR969_01455 [Candidatus Saccharibacteria bacterium]